MNSNCRFTVAIHAMTMLALRQEERLTSETIAGSVTTNPVVIRRILGELRRAGLVVSQAGFGGGWMLAQAPEQITLCAVYNAVKERGLFALHHHQPNPYCVVGNAIQQALTGIFDEAEAAIERQFAQTTIADVLARMQATYAGPQE